MAETSQTTTQETCTASDPQQHTIQEPPKKKKKIGTRYWLVKVPKWVAEEWFDPTKYGPQQRLADLYILPHENPDRREMKLELMPSMMQRSTNSLHASSSSSSSSSLSEYDDIAIPRKMKMDVRADRQRVNVKHGELTVLGKDRLLMFYDKPAFPVGSKVEALDTSTHQSSSMYGSDAEPDKDDDDDDDDEDDDIKMRTHHNSSKSKKNAKKKKNVFTAIKGYARGAIKGINADRTYTVQFEHGNKMRYAVPERDIRFIDADEADKANKCKIQAVVHTEMDMVPQWTPQYKEFLKIRAMKKSLQNSIKLKEKVDVYTLTEAERKRHADKQIEENRRERDALRNRKTTKNGANEGGKPKRVKSVRKDDEVYQSLIFAAFDQQSVLSQKDMVQKCSGEKWNFLRPIVEKLCTAHKDKGKNGKLWALRPEYRLSTDAKLESHHDEDHENDNTQ